MYTNVMGKIITRKFEVVAEIRDDGTLKEKPYIRELTPNIEWKEICSYEGAPQLNSYMSIWNDDTDNLGTINISEEESVGVIRHVFRADINNYYQYTDKILEDKPNNYEECKEELTSALRLYNAQKIEKNRKAKAYCDLHKLDYAETDYDKLMDIIEPNWKCTSGLRGLMVGGKPLPYSRDPDFKLPFKL